MDSFDRNILKCLQEDGRMSNVELSERIHLSPPQTMRRMRTLEESGVIRRYTALVEPHKVGLGVQAFVMLTLTRERMRNDRDIERTITSFSEVIECHTLSGEFDYILRVMSADLKSLSQFLIDKLQVVPGVVSTHSMICMEEIKPLSSVPI